MMSAHAFAAAVPCTARVLGDGNNEDLQTARAAIANE
jgi:hypothetical protein